MPAKRNAISLSRLRTELYEGEDADLGICLREQGFAAKQFRRQVGTVRKGSYMVIFRVYPDTAPKSELWFNARIIDRDLDWTAEWVDLYADHKRFFQWLGTTEEEFSLKTLPATIKCLLDFYGVLNVFGVPCNSFQIAGL